LEMAWNWKLAHDHVNPPGESNDGLAFSVLGSYWSTADRAFLIAGRDFILAVFAGDGQFFYDPFVYQFSSNLTRQSSPLQEIFGLSGELSAIHERVTLGTSIDHTIGCSNHRNPFLRVRSMLCDHGLAVNIWSDRFAHLCSCNITESMFSPDFFLTNRKDLTLRIAVLTSQILPVILTHRGSSPLGAAAHDSFNIKFSA